MLTAIGLWPYQTSVIMQVQTVFFLGAYYFILLFQVFLGYFFLRPNASLNDSLLILYKFDMLYHIYVLQFMTFLTSTCNLEFIFRELSYIFMTMFGIITYNSCYFNSKEVSIPCNFIWRGLLSREF